MAHQLLTQAEIDARARGVHAEWTATTGALSRSIEFADFVTAVEFITLLAPRCEKLDHHPDLGLHWRRVDVELSTHSAGGVTGLDFELAEAVDEIAAGLPQA
ncbi:MAG TPA: 4a-hydroxytetrahydrobiopterin dehydratase [Jatrophihabitantaceae bacterium]|jgi:4a-hydroxytetrahydrobiopterin dehydratase|nr:4a-hydroxytetrahydrobiopterin dehydratase [Jatrophihabitantaceae bacterium]